MFVRTLPLSSLKKGFLSQLHQPLPLNPRESQQLLHAITSSFRKNLDREHPWEADETSTNTPLKPSTTDSTENIRPTDRHLRAILSNPLFAHSPDARTNIQSPSASTSHNSPFDVFDSAVSKGLMTTRRAAGFLATIRSQLLSESHEDIRQRMGASGAGLRVLRWLRASGQESSLDFLSDTALIKFLIPFLYAEGLQEVAWIWLAQLVSRAAPLEFEKTPGKANAQTLSRLMAAVIMESSLPVSQYPMSLDESFAALAKVNGMLPSKNPAATAAMRGIWTKLSWASTVTASERPKPSATLFEEFVEIGRPLNLPLDLAHLDLHHPTHPTHLAAIEYLRIRQRIAEDLSGMKPQLQQRVLCLVMDAGARLKQTGQFSEAPWLERLRKAIYDKLDLGILNIQMGGSLGSSGTFQRWH